MIVWFSMAETGPEFSVDRKARERREAEWRDRSQRRMAGLVHGLETTPIDWESETSTVGSIAELRSAAMNSAEAGLRRALAGAPAPPPPRRELFGEEE